MVVVIYLIYAPVLYSVTYPPNPIGPSTSGGILHGGIKEYPLYCMGWIIQLGEI
jgi:hypothetical protein